MICALCSGSGACDPCDGYGTLPDSYPNAGDGADCIVCDGSGICPNCAGTTHDDSNDDSAQPGAILGVMA
jgi:hypothetical protein